MFVNIVDCAILYNESGANKPKLPAHVCARVGVEPYAQRPILV